ncbi:YoaK family protein [Streptomyces sp. NPDC092296]|uniref:YoaK family protein n=1 Tax=Streptomyces sp. NPDC092296 TaxID=3366012 RepID=UPI0038251104
MPERSGGPLLVALVVLTTVSGFLDAVSYLGLGRVFTANMTGNVLFLGFSAAGATGFSVARSLLALAGFAVGTLAGGRLAVAVARTRRWWVCAALSTEALLIAAAAVVAGTAAGMGGRYAAIGVLAMAMGVRNATVRRLAVPDMKTTVLTMTLTGLIAESSLAGGANPRLGRRVGSVVAMAAGAAAGGWLVLRHGVVPALAIAAGCVLGVGLVYVLVSGLVREGGR